MKLGIFARREPGVSAILAQWDCCNLPAPTTRVAFAAIEPNEKFALRTGVLPWATSQAC